MEIPDPFVFPHIGIEFLDLLLEFLANFPPLPFLLDLQFEFHDLLFTVIALKDVLPNLPERSHLLSVLLIETHLLLLLDPLSKPLALVEDLLFEGANGLIDAASSDEVALLHEAVLFATELLSESKNMYRLRLSCSIDLPLGALASPSLALALSFLLDVWCRVSESDVIVLNTSEP